MSIRTKVIILFTFIFFPLCFNAMNINQATTSNDKWHSILGEMVNEIALKYFSNLHCTLIVTEEESKIENIENFIPSNIQRLNVLIKKHAKNMTFLEDNILFAFDEKCLGYIFMVSDPISMISLLEKSYRLSEQRATRRFLFLPVSQPKDASNETLSLFDEMFSMREMDFFPEIVVARFSTSEDVAGSRAIELLTHKFSKKITSNELIILDIWNQRRGFRLSSNLYPDKISNLMGKTLTIATFNYPPYAIVDLEATPSVFDGTETRVFLEFCKTVNATSRVIVDAVNQWGEIYENASGNGILGTVSEDRADVGYGAIYLWRYEYSYVDYSVSYIRTGITCIAPRPHPLSGWLIPILPFTSVSWSAVGASVLASSLSLFLITKASSHLLGQGEISSVRYSSLWNCVFNAVGLLVLQAPPDERSATRITGAARHVLVWLTLMFLLIATSYSSGLASILTVPRFGPPIETVDDLAYSNLPWAATHPAWIFSLRDARDSRTLLLLSHFRIMTAEELSKHSAIGDIAFSVERLPAGHYAIGDYIREEDVSKRLRLMKQDIYYEHVPMITRKGSPYMAKLNKLILRLVDSGIILKWEEQVVNKNLPTRVQHAVSQSRGSASDGHRPTELQLRHIQGGLYLLATGLTISVTTYFCEVVYYNYSKYRLRSRRGINRMY